MKSSCRELNPIWDRWFSTYAKLSGKLAFLTPSFSETFFVRTKWLNPIQLLPNVQIKLISVSSILNIIHTILFFFPIKHTNIRAYSGPLLGATIAPNLLPWVLPTFTGNSSVKPDLKAFLVSGRALSQKALVTPVKFRLFDNGHYLAQIYFPWNFCLLYMLILQTFNYHLPSRESWSYQQCKGIQRRLALIRWDQ